MTLALPQLRAEQQLPELYQQFLRQLSESGFAGDIQSDYATRLSSATDNSVYQLLPIAVVFPRSSEDVQSLTQLASKEEYRTLKLSPRGGGTGTNGQSLCDGIIVDVSRYMNQILEVDLEQGWVEVQPGVVLDQLNDTLRPHGVFFAPNLSPSSRATIGGMINTDASGKGSRVYGKTSNHLLELEVVLLDGQCHRARAVSPDELDRLKQAKGTVGRAYRAVDEIVQTHAAKIEAEFPKLQRFLTGYDLAHVYDAEGCFHLEAVLAGSEGTLGFITQARLKLTSIPKYKRLVAVRYHDFDAALRAAQVLAQSGPGAIETVDDTIVGLAKQDVIWQSVEALLSAPDEPPLAAVNLIEFESDDEQLVLDKVQALCSVLDAERGLPKKSTGYTVASHASDIAALWSLRKKGVGLLGNVQGERRPVPFVEDTAVPPERLADYIAEFRQILDAHGLRYGMFGHVDVGCLHVRPALNMRDERDEKLLRQISDQVVQLVKRHGGVLWAEHGKGFRSEYSPTFFGPELYQELRKVKAAFDPHNQLNPGKLATPIHGSHKLISIDAAKRGTFDRQITESNREAFSVAVHCNGNGACFDYHPDHVMCPSSKVTRDRIHSPKGRAGMLREWLRLASKQGYDASRLPERDDGVLGKPRTDPREDFSHEVYAAMDGCLACRACATQCPVKVDIPSMRAEFYAHYHSRYRRPLKDYFVALLEPMMLVLGLWPRLTNWLMGLRLSQALLRWVGIVDSPRLSERRLMTELARRNAPRFDADALARLSETEKQRTVLIAQDVFTTFYESNVALAAYEVLTALGFRAVFLPYQENGKALHIKGFLRRFHRVVRRNTEFLAKVGKLHIPIVGLEPAVTLTYREEYPRALKQHPSAPSTDALPKVELIQEFLARKLPQTQVPQLSAERYRLFGHCTERTSEGRSQAQWQTVFRMLGLELGTESVGCCGMCGVYGHETSHFEESRGIFAMSWARQLPESPAEQRFVLAQGHSCRSQVKRFAGFVPAHPLEALAQRLRRGQLPS